MMFGGVSARYNWHFQRQTVLGNQIEMDMMMTVEDNDSLLRVGVAFQSMEARHRVSEALERNYERCECSLSPASPAAVGVPFGK